MLRNLLKRIKGFLNLNVQLTKKKKWAASERLRASESHMSNCMVASQTFVDAAATAATAGMRFKYLLIELTYKRLLKKWFFAAISTVASSIAATARPNPERRPTTPAQVRPAPKRQQRRPATATLQQEPANFGAERLVRSAITATIRQSGQSGPLQATKST